jgi:hypothetical protein
MYILRFIQEINKSIFLKELGYVRDKMVLQNSSQEFKVTQIVTVNEISDESTNLKLENSDLKNKFNICTS